MQITGAGWLLPATLGILAGSAVALWLGRRRGVHALAPLWIVTALALLAARLAFVFQHFGDYAAAPLALLDLGDGGFAPMAGLFAAFVAGAELARRVPARRRPLLAAALAGLAVWVAAAVGTLDFSPARTPVPQAAVQTLDGKPVRLRALAGKPMVVNLWASWCPPCRREMPVLQAAQRRYPGVTFVFVNEGESRGAIENYLAAQRLDLDNLFSDPRGDFAAQAQAFAFPTTLFFDSRGILFMRQVGGLTEAALAERLALLDKARRDSPSGTSPATDPRSSAPASR